jgi:hypothetical protein
MNRQGTVVVVIMNDMIDVGNAWPTGKLSAADTADIKAHIPRFDDQMQDHLFAFPDRQFNDIAVLGFDFGRKLTGFIGTECQINSRSMVAVMGGDTVVNNKLEHDCRLNPLAGAIRFA